MSNDTPILPRLKERVMYISKTASSSKIQSSYSISSSFKGILRLSPNNHNTVNEKNYIQLSIADEKALGTTYTDAIVFDDEALKSTKTDATIERRMIIGSDSDGYLVNFRISNNDIEFNNLGVMGTLQANEGVFLYGKNNSKKPMLELGNSVLPHFANGQNPKDITYGIICQKDEKKIDVLGQGDNSTLAYAMTEDGKRVFKHKKTSLFIKELIMQALLSLKTIPTGSIHWLPVTYEQYKVLMGKDDYAKELDPADFANLVSDKNNTLLRDFLLCDGRQYDTYKFPELAKVLWGQRVVKWETASIDNTNGDQVVGLYPVNTKNGYDEKGKDIYTEPPKDQFGVEAAKKFRVPDLRHMFMASCQIYENMQQINSQANAFESSDYNTTGTYTPDTLPKGINSKTDVDTHFHFIAYGTNGMQYRCTSQDFTNDANVGIQEVAKYADGWNPLLDSITDQQERNPKLKLNAQAEAPTIMYLQNHPYYRKNGWGGTNGTGSDKGANGFSYGQFSPQRSCEWKNLRTNYSIPAIMYLSMPGLGENAKRSDLNPYFNTESMKYKSSTQFLSVFEAKDNTVYDADKNNRYKGETYAEFRKEIYGHENTPKYYTMLPLIKI